MINVNVISTVNINIIKIVICRSAFQILYVFIYAGMLLPKLSLHNKDHEKRIKHIGTMKQHWLNLFLTSEFVRC